jgi:hypothetical protein
LPRRSSSSRIPAPDGRSSRGRLSCPWSLASGWALAELDNLMKADSAEFKAFIEEEAEKYKDVLG